MAKNHQIGAYAVMLGLWTLVFMTSVVTSGGNLALDGKGMPCAGRVWFDYEITIDIPAGAPSGLKTDHAGGNAGLFVRTFVFDLNGLVAYVMSGTTTGDCEMYHRGDTLVAVKCNYSEIPTASMGDLCSPSTA